MNPYALYFRNSQCENENWKLVNLVHTSRSEEEATHMG